MALGFVIMFVLFHIYFTERKICGQAEPLRCASQAYAFYPLILNYLYSKRGFL